MTNAYDTTRQPHRMNRGNTLVLVTAILVLLVIIATAFISRTQTGRQLAVAQQHAFQREASASVHADAIADEISRALFPRAVDPGNQAVAWGFGDGFSWVDNANANGLDLAELTLSGVPRASDSTPWLMNSGPGSPPDPSLDWLNNAIAVERFGPDLGDYFSYDVAGQLQLGSDGFRDELFDFNFAPFETRAWTNWPDDTGTTLLVPYGPGALDILGGARLRDDNPNGSLPLGSGNPRGNPGFGDSRWLRDTEPRRVGNYYDGPGYYASNPAVETFTHWTHLSWLPTAENGWRICADISNVAPFDQSFDYVSTPEGAVDAGYTLSKTAFEGNGNRPYHDADFPVAIQTPYEQWYPNVIPSTPQSVDDLIYRRNLWFSAPQDHFNAAMRSPDSVLPNYFDLESWGPEKDKYVLGSWRNAIERIFADADGDGFTDSFWFLPPASTVPGVRQVVGVSIIDNNSMLDANVATSFDRWSTSGATPADAALVSRLDGDFDTWVGLFADPKNKVTDLEFYPTLAGVQIEQAFDTNEWFATANPDDTTFLNVRGVADLVQDGNDAGPFYGQYRAVIGDEPEAGVRERKLWNRLAQNDFRGSWIKDDGSGATQLIPYSAVGFDLTDELELRSFNGLNHPTRFTRFERALGDHVTNPGSTARSFLRSHIDRPEVAPIREYGPNFNGPNGPIPVTRVGSNTNQQQVRDNRHRITLYSGARNEFRPLWLWQTPYFKRDYDYDRDGVTHFEGDWDDFDEYQRRRRKIDLRQTYALPPDNPPDINSPIWLENRRLYLNDLQDVITRTMTVYGYDPITDRTVPQSYFSNPEWDLDDEGGPQHGGADQTLYQEAYIKSLKMAASFTANIEAFRDGPQAYNVGNQVIYRDQPLHPYNGIRVPLIDPNDSSSIITPVGGDDPRADVFIGLEKQPFIMQAYFGLVYPKSDHEEGPILQNGQRAWEAGDSIPMLFLDGGENYVDSKSKPAIVIAIQLGNPFDEPVSLYDFKLRIGDNQSALDITEFLPLSVLSSPHPEAPNSGNSLGPFGYGYEPRDLYLGPTEPDAPRSVVVFALVPPSALGYDDEFENGNGTVPGFGVSYEQFKEAWLDTLDLLPGELFGYEEGMPLSHHQSLVLDASRLLGSRLPGNAEERLDTIFGDNDHVVQLARTIDSTDSFLGSVNVVLDRLQHEREQGQDPRNIDFNDTMVRLTSHEHIAPKASYYFDQNDSTRREWAGIRLGTDDYFLTWARVSRIWGWDVDASGIYDMDEVSPRYAYSVVSGPDLVTKTQSGYLGEDQGYAPTSFKGDAFGIQATLPGQPDQNLWMSRRVYTLPVTKLTEQLQPGWDWQDGSSRPTAWEVRGKPTNFPTWSVLGIAGSNAEYGNGFPLEVMPANGGNWNNNSGYWVQERTISPSGQGTSFSGKNIIPMDLCAAEQEDFYKEYRQDLWSAPMQMLLKDGDIEQIGELTHAFLWGPVFNLPIGADPSSYPNPIPAKRTFAELMTEVIEYKQIGEQGSPTVSTPVWWGMGGLDPDEYPVGTGPLANRLDIGQGHEPFQYTYGFDPGRPWRQVLGSGLQIPAFRPYVPAGSGLFDAVTVDARGMNASHPDYDGDGSVSLNESVQAEQNRFDLARGYTGEPTRGLININTAPVEVMRTLPQMSRLVYNDYFETDHGNTDLYLRGQVQRSSWFNPGAGGPVGAANNMHVRVAETIERYRSGDAAPRFADGSPVPSMADRGFRGTENDGFDDYPTIIPNSENDFYGFFPGMRTDRGIVSLGELLSMQRTQYDEGTVTGNSPFAPDWRSKSASIRSLGLNPYALSTLNGNYSKGYGYPNASFGQSEPDEYARERYFLGWRDERAYENVDTVTQYLARTSGQLDSRVSTDRNTERRNIYAYRNFTDAADTVFAPDMVGGDAEELNMLFSGMANMITTRSDVFTIYMTIRTFKQDPVTGVWDATRKENVIDESRYMVIIDRSTVGWPTEQPRTLAFLKIE